MQDLLPELYPEENSRPKLIGPDMGGLRGNDLDQWEKGVEYLREYVDSCKELDVNLYALTHHEYVEVPFDDYVWN